MSIGQSKSIAQRLTDVEAAMGALTTDCLEAISRESHGTLRAAEQDARTQDAILKQRVEHLARWLSVTVTIAGFALIVAFVAVVK